MCSRLCKPLSALLALLAGVAWTVFAQDTALDGDWLASLQTGDQVQHLTLHVTQGFSGSLALSLEGIGRREWSYPGEGMLRDGHVNFHIFIADASFQGTLSPDGRKMSGTWTEGVPAPLEFTRQPGLGSPARTFEPTPVPAPAISPVTLTGLKPILDREMQPVLENGLPRKTVGGGVVVGVLDHGQRRIFSYGSARPDSIFEIASITKTFTGLALAQMVAQSKVALNESVRSLLPGLSIAPSTGAEISLLDLATHYSGLPSDPNNLWPFNPRNPYADYDSDRLLEFIEGRGLTKPSGTAYMYCNFGYGLLGFVLARQARVSYEQLVRTQIAGPLHLDDTVVTLSREQRKRLIQGYDSNFNRAGTWDFGVLDGEGALKSTAADLLTYLDANLHPEKYAAGAPPGTPLATLPATIGIDHQLRADADPGDKIALAWFFHEQPRYFSHDGKGGGYNSRVAFYPEQDRAIVVLYNRDHLSPAGLSQLVNRIADNIEELMSGRPTTRIDFVYQDERALKPANQALASARRTEDLRRAAAVAAAVPLPTPEAVRTSPPIPGMNIDLSNATSYAPFIPSAAELAIDHGFTMRIVPTERLDWSGGFTAQTEKYSAQVGLDRDDHITNYVAGMPFPTVSLDDPKAAVKIAYNWHMGPFMPDDFSMAPWGSFAYLSLDS
jgi:serine-type D-Ala-D-Ala carboxypeptidase/endopeptidase